MNYITRSEEDTLRISEALAQMLSAGDTLLLHGDLGTGKSVLARGVAHALGVQGAMPSPTFTLLIPYQGKCKIYHYDLYRLNDPDEFYAAGLDEFIGGDGVALVEWPEMADVEIRPALHIYLERVEEDTETRRIRIENDGVTGFDEAMLQNWRADK